MQIVKHDRKSEEIPMHAHVAVMAMLQPIVDPLSAWQIYVSISNYISNSFRCVSQMSIPSSLILLQDEPQSFVGSIRVVIPEAELLRLCIVCLLRRVI